MTAPIEEKEQNGNGCPTPGFNIAIIGAGIGGLALAIGLARLGVPFTLYESAPAFSAVGAGMGLGPNALRAMDGIDKRFRSMYTSIATGNLNPEKRHLMMEAMLIEEGLGEAQPWWGHGGWGAPNFERTGAHRKDLLDIMTSFIPAGSVRFGKRVESITQAGGVVHLAFEDGTIACHAAIIGCDGVRGFTRRVVLGSRYPDCVEPQYTGKYVYRAVLSMAEAKEILGDLAMDAKMFMGRGASLTTYPISEGREVNVVAFKRCEEQWTHPDFTWDVPKEVMMDDFNGNKPDPRLVKLLDHAEPTRWGIFHHPDTPTYYNQQICLLGDVAHAGGPYQGAGAGQCLEDAYILSRVLGKLYHSHESNLLYASPRRTTLIEAAFQAYDEIRRPRAQKQVRTTHCCGEIYSFSDPVIGADVVRIVENMNRRYTWIWEHDLDADVHLAESRFDELTSVGYTDSQFRRLESKSVDV